MRTNAPGRCYHDPVQGPHHRNLMTRRFDDSRPDTNVAALDGDRRKLIAGAAAAVAATVGLMALSAARFREPDHEGAPVRRCGMPRC
jgi:hypothetical protein